MTIPVGERGPELLGTVGLFLALTTITIALRCYCRIFIVKNFGMDDYFAVLAYILFIIYSTFAISGTHYGTGQHYKDIAKHGPDVFPTGLMYWWACEPSYILCLMALKISIGIFLLRIAASTVHKVIIWVVIVITTVYSAFFFFLFLLQCLPSKFFWEQHTPAGVAGEITGKCINPQVTVDAFYAYSAISCVGDWILGVLPAFMVWKLQMNTRTKISVACILAVGAIASSATIIRIPYINGMSNIADFLWATTDVAIWSTVEGGIGISASAAATLRPLFRAFFGSSFGSQGGSSVAWGTPGLSGRPSGYMRSGKGFDGNGVMLRSDVGHKQGTVTTIRGREDEDLERGGSGGNSNPAGWSESSGDGELKLRSSSEESGDEYHVGGIVKTTKMTQVRE